MADDLLDQHLFVRLDRRQGANESAIADDSNPIGNLQHFVDIVRDKDHAGTPSLNLADQCEKPFDVCSRQKSSRLIQDQQAALAGTSLSLHGVRGSNNRQQCACTYGNIFHPGERIEVEIKLFHEIPGRLDLILPGNVPTTLETEVLSPKILQHGQ